MNLPELTGRHFRLRRGPAAAYSPRPWNIEHNDRAAREPCAAPISAPELTAQSSHEWLGLFSVHLMQLRPSMSASSAMQYALMSIRHAMDFHPEHAAELLVAVEPSDTPVTPRSVDAQREPPSARYEAMFTARI